MATAWDQSTEYIRTSNWAQTRSGPTNYVAQRPAGAAPADFTSFHPGQATWSPTHLPNVLYILNPPPEWDAYRQLPLPKPKLDATGHIIYERWPSDINKPEPLLDFPHLPDQIGSQEWWFVIEAWRRLEPRARWKDFTMRIHGPSRPSSHNIIQMHISRNRPKWGLLSWFPITLHGEQNRAREEALGLLSDEQIRDNTTRGTTPGLINPALGEAGGRIPLPVSKVGAGIRRGRRAPGKGHGGGNNQAKYKDKTPVRKTQTVRCMLPRTSAQRKRKANVAFGTIPDLQKWRARKIARPRRSALERASYSDHSCKAPRRKEVPPQLASSSIAGNSSSVRRLRPEGIPASAAEYSLHTTSPADERSNISGTLPACKKEMTTPKRPMRPPVDGADSSGRTIHHDEAPLTNRDLDFKAYLNESDSNPEGDSLAALNQSDRISDLTSDNGSFQFCPPLSQGNILPGSAESPICDTDQVGLLPDQGDNQETDYGIFDLPLWQNESLTSFDSSTFGQDVLGLGAWKPTTSSDVVWENFDLDF